MKTKNKKNLILGAIFIFAFAIWTMLIQIIDVQAVGINNTDEDFCRILLYYE